MKPLDMTAVREKVTSHPFTTLMQVDHILKTGNGRVYVDQIEEPTSFMIASKDHNIYVFGNDKNDLFNEQVLRYIFDDKPKMIDDSEYEFYLYLGESFKENTSFVQKLNEHFIYPEERRYYKFSLEEHLEIPAMNSYEIVPVNRALIDDNNLENIDEIIEWMSTEAWNEPEDFLDSGFGYCVLDGQTIASWCMADYVTDEKCEIGVETDEDYQQRGLASAAVSKALEHAKMKGIKTVGWQCFASNEASIKTALRNGFTLEKTFVPYFGWFNKVDNLLVHGNLRYEEGDFHEAKKCYDHFIEILQADEITDDTIVYQKESLSGIYVRIAEVYAELGDDQATMAYLQKARNEGFEHFDKIKDRDSFKAVKEKIDRW